MCISPIKIVNRSKIISRYYNDPYLINVPCNNCVECHNSKSLEWTFRIQQEALSTFSKHGFVLFDTLTYAKTPMLSDIFDVPNLRDFSCFNYDHVKNFLKRLRKYLSDRGYDVKDKLRYFICSEFGSELNTRRPHYHVLFFSCVSGLDFVTLSKSISQCWTFGRTDGIPFKSVFYVKNNIFYNLASGLNLFKYVAKYVNKGFTFVDNVKYSLNYVVEYFGSLFGKNFYFTSDGVSLKRLISRKVMPFHVQSKGFGLSFLDDYDVSEYINGKNVNLVDSQSVLMSIPLPKYYSRKLTHDLYRFSDGSYHWILNDFGKSIKSRRLPFVLSRVHYKLNDLNMTFNLGFDNHSIQELSDYCVNKSGFVLNGNSSVHNMFDSLDYDVIYNHVTNKDYDVHKMFFVEFSVDGINHRYSIKEFVDEFCYKDQKLDSIYKVLYSKHKDIGLSKNNLAKYIDKTKSKLESLCYS